MENQLYSISKIFTEKLYRIPDYQRGYAWQLKHLKEFWTDLIQLEIGKNHYLGVLTLEPVMFDVYSQWKEDYWIIDSKSYAPFFVVDGQQRLTTTIILLQAILETVKDDKSLNYDTVDEIKKKYVFDTKDKGLSRSYIFGYEKDNPSYEYLKTKIFLEISESGYIGEETIYTTNLQNAKAFFLESIKEYTHPELETLYKKITQHLLFNTYSISNDLDVFITFETMNNRGKPLSNLELLKNRLIYLSTKLNCDDLDRSFLRRKINDSWKGVYHFLGKNKSIPLDDDQFLKFHFFYFFAKELLKKAKEQQDKELLKHDLYYIIRGYDVKLFNDIFTVKRTFDNTENPLTKEDLDKYTSSLLHTGEIWYKIHYPRECTDFTEEEQVLIEKMNRMEDFNEVAPILVFIFSRKKVRKNLRRELLEILERVSFIKSIAYSYDFDPALSFEILAADLFSNELSLEELNSNLRSTLEKIITNEVFLNKVTRFFAYRGFYRWGNIRYFLFEYEESLKVRAKSKTRKIKWDEFKVELSDYETVEHIFPQKAKDEYWRYRFSIYSIREKRLLCDSLGNLLPLAKGKNSSLQNNSFPLKVEGSGMVGYRFGSFSEIEVSKQPCWTSKQIFERGIRLLSFMEKRWGIKLGSETDKQKLLGLEFYNERLVPNYPN